MKKDEFIKDWKKFLIDIGKSETVLAKEIGTTQPNLNQKTSNATIRYLELSEIVEKYGYSIKIHKGDTQK
jgi:hypothetical protein